MSDKKFEWGVSTAAYQIEGAYNEDGKGLSIWDEFSNKTRKIKDRTHGQTACNHYHFWESDVNLLSYLNIPNYRFSISWPRLIPEGIGKVNPKGIGFYDRLIDQLLEKNIEPWLTLYHWDLPLALQKKGGWTNREILFWFEEYVSLCAEKYGDRVKNWMVLNEPMAFTGVGHFLGLHAPGKRGIGNFISTVHHATLCQSLGGKILRDYNEKLTIGTTFSCMPILSMTDSELDIKAQKRGDALFNRLFIEPALGMGFPWDDLPILRRLEKKLKPNDLNNMTFDFDFWGLQNYTREYIKSCWYVPYVQAKIVHARKRNVPFNSMGWEIYPQSLYDILQQFHKYDKKKSLIVTESGFATKGATFEQEINDKARLEFLEKCCELVMKAKNEGLPIDGYFIWTLLDNFEWAEGFSQRFGLVHVDHSTQKRTIKKSGLWFKEMMENQKVEKLWLSSL